MEEQANFEKKSTKKIGIIIAICVIVALLIVGLLFILSIRKPEKIFKGAVAKVFDVLEEEPEKINSGRVELELSGDINGDDEKSEEINSIVKNTTLNFNTEFDVDKKILNENVSAYYEGKQVVSADVLLQDGRVYGYLNGIFDKYFDLTDDLLGDSDVDLNVIFADTTEHLNKELLEGVEDVILEYIEDKDLEQSKEEFNGKKVRKSTITITSEELVNLVLEVLKEVNEHESNEEIEALIEDLEKTVESDNFNETNKIQISLYTKGIKQELVRCVATIIENDEEVGAIKYEKIDDNKSIISVTFEGEFIAAIIDKQDKVTTIDIAVDKEGISVDGAKELLNITINKENENEGNIKFSAQIEEIKINLNVKYKIEKNISIEKKNTNNSITINEITETDKQEMDENIKDNEILNSIVNTIISEDSQPDYEYDLDYNYNSAVNF